MHAGAIQTVLIDRKWKGVHLPTRAVQTPASVIMKLRKQAAECCLSPLDGAAFFFNHPPQPPFLFSTNHAVSSFILTVWFKLPFPGSRKGWQSRKDERRWCFDSSFFTIMSNSAFSSPAPARRGLFFIEPHEGKIASWALPSRDWLDKLGGSVCLLWALPIQSLLCSGAVFCVFPVYNHR